MSNGKPKRKTEAAGDAAPPVAEMAVWTLFAIALAATLYILLKEPEEGPPTLDEFTANFRVVALGAAALGGGIGLDRILRQSGGQNLFAMAVLLNLIMACFWILRFALAG